MESCGLLELLLAQMRKVDSIFEKSNAGKSSYSEICEALSEIMNANVYILSSKGKVLGSYFQNAEDSSVISELGGGDESIADEENRDLMKIDETVVSEDGCSIFSFVLNDPEKKQYRKPHMIVPVYSKSIRFGTLMFARYGKAFETRDIILAEHVAVIVGAEMERRKRSAAAEKQRKENAALLALEGLTGSERMIVQNVFSNMETDTALIVASKVADQAKIARTQMASALRKLEIAGILEVHSFGSKGTQIRLLNPKFCELLGKSKKF